MFSFYQDFLTQGSRIPESSEDSRLSRESSGPPDLDPEAWCMCVYSYACACLCASVCIWLHDCVSMCTCVHIDTWSCGQTHVSVCVCVRIHVRMPGRAQPRSQKVRDPALPTPAGFCFLLAWRTHAITLPASRMAGRRTGPRLSTWRWKRPHRLSHIVVLNLTIPQSSQGRQEEAPADEEEEAPGPAPGGKDGEAWSAAGASHRRGGRQAPTTHPSSRASRMAASKPSLGSSSEKEEEQKDKQQQTAGTSPRPPHPQCVSSVGF